jgi:hypothetical protein
VVRSWHPSAVSGPVAKFNKIYFFFKQLSMSYILEIWFPNTEQSTVFKAIFVLCLYATHSVIFVNNPKLVHRRQPYPNNVAVFSLRRSRAINHRIKRKPGIIYSILEYTNSTNLYFVILRIVVCLALFIPMCYLIHKE